jgi:hypothetical protein
MSQQKKLEKVLDLLLSEDQSQAAELLHQIIVEKARVIYESIVEEEDDQPGEAYEADEVGGEPSKDFTDEISSDEDEVDTDEQNDGEAEDDEDGDDFGDDMDDMDGMDDSGEVGVEGRVEDLETQLSDLRAEFDALMGEEMQEPYHLGDPLDGEVSTDMDDMDGMDGMDDMDDMGSDMPGMNGEEKVVGEVVATMFEKKAKAKLEVAPQTKKTVKGKRADEETQFLNKVADTGQRGTAKLVGTGKNSPLGAEQTQSPYTNAPTRKDYGGSAKNILGSRTTGGEYGKYHGDHVKNNTPSDNVKVVPKNSSIKADTTAKFTGGKPAGEGFTKSPLTKKPT